jgi:hypothetical protein
MATPDTRNWFERLRERARGQIARWSALLDPGSTEAGASGGTAAEAERLALAFARFITGETGGFALRRVMAAARPEAFWAALEAFTDNIAGEEWRVVSRELLPLDEVESECRRLRHPSAWTRALAARHLGLLNARGMRASLREAMRRGPSLATFTAALALARMRDREALDWLLDHPDATALRSRQQLVALLKRFGRGGVSILREAISGWTVQSPIHLAAVEVVGVWEDHESLPALGRMLRAGDLEARVAAARALGGIGGRSALPALVAALDDQAWQVRAQAARALGRMPDPNSIAPLGACVRDVAWWVRRNAAYAIALHGAAGRVTLEAIARQRNDVFASEMAAEVLQLIEWERESPGGLSRVA